MPRQSNSTYQAPANTSAVSHAQISSTAFNTLETDIGNEITNSLDRLGRGAMQANLPMGGFRITGQLAGSATNDGATVNQAQSGVLSQAISVSGVDTIVLTFAPQFPSLVAGTRIKWASAGVNLTTTPTVNVDTIGAVTLLRNGGSAIVAGDTGASGYECDAIYNGTNWLLMNPAALNVTAAGNNAFSGNNTHAGTETFNGPVINNGSVTNNGSSISNEQVLTWTNPNTSWDMSLGPDAVVTLTGATTNLSAPTNQAQWKRGQLRIVQDATGGRAFTCSTNYVTDRGLVPSIYPGANVETVFNYWCKGASGAGSIVLTPRTESTPQVIIEDRETAGTAAQTLTAGTDTTRTLNTLVSNFGTLASLSSNQFTLPAGTYYIRAYAGFSSTSGSYGRLLLFDVGSSVNQIIGLGGAGSSGGGASVIQNLDGVFTITGPKTYALNHRVINNNALGGQPVSDGRVEVYAHLEITKLS